MHVHTCLANIDHSPSIGQVWLKPQGSLEGIRFPHDLPIGVVWLKAEERKSSGKGSSPNGAETNYIQEILRKSAPVTGEFAQRNCGHEENSAVKSRVSPHDFAIFCWLPYSPVCIA